MKKIGKITHYYGNIGVAIIELSGKMSKGDKIKVEHSGEEFEQAVESMQMEHKDIDAGKKGDSVGIKVEQKVHEGDEVFLME